MNCESGLIAIAQIDPIVGNFEINYKKIEESYLRACRKNCRILVTPELGICGYPLYDLLDHPEIFERNERVLKDLGKLTKHQICALAVGHIAPTGLDRGRPAQNVVTVLENGHIQFRQAKTLLPTYDIFDEARYFEPAKNIELWNCDGVKVAFAICEDLWAEDPKFGRQLYTLNPVSVYQEKKASIIFSLSASPFERDKRELRESLHQKIAKTLQIPLIYNNQVGATDEVLFDGASFALDKSGRSVAKLATFEPDFAVLQWNKVSGDLKLDESTNTRTAGHDPKDGENEYDLETLKLALVTGIREYFKKTGYQKALIGLSGGIDSSVVVTLLALALGHRNVLAIAMPSQYSSPASLEDADTLAKNLKIQFEVRPIKFSHSVLKSIICEKRGKLSDIACENLQARIRGLMLMTLSNHDGSLVVTTGNKSELAMGYCTLYGDMVGALAPLGDLYKVQVYELGHYLNKILESAIPERCFTRPPTAELKFDQTDQDTLPPYEILDIVLKNYIEKNETLESLEKNEAILGLFQNLDPKMKKKLGRSWIRDTLRCVDRNEYKRRQAAPVLKVSSKAFGVGRRIPIAKYWDQ